MKNKLLLFLVFHFLLAFTTEGKPTKRNTSPKLLVVQLNKKPTPYKYDPTPFFAPKKALLLLPPTVTGGSSCGPGSVTLTAIVSSGETAEWFTSQNATTPIATGPTFTTPLLTATTTYYVQAKSTTDTSTRVPVVAIIQNQPPSVSLSVTPASNSTNPICEGTSLTFTATGGGDVFEFSVDGTVRQAFSTNRTFTTTTITNNQTVTVRTRYAVTYDGVINENAWGTGSYEDNTQSAALSTNAINGYINSLRITPTEDKLVFGITGKLINYRRVLVFLDTKPGGFNVSNYGDENGSLPSVRAYNFFNNNPSTFDSYFEADYCLAIATDIGETNYYADIIELKNPNSIKTYLGTAATGVPSAVMGVNKNNTGITDYSNGFEIELLKSQLGYTGNDIKFFAFTMQDNDVSNYNVTNSFLSPELTKTIDFGRNAVNYNNETPNPVIVSASAMTPCYSSASISMPMAAAPTVATTGPNQPLCSLTSNPLGGNTPLSGTGIWTLKSGPGSVTFEDSSSPNSRATVSLPGTYVFTWTISNGQCQSSSADITAVFNLTNPPVADANQTFCKIDQPTVANLIVTGNAVQWFLNSTGGTALNSTTALSSQTYYAEQTDSATLCVSTTRTPVSVTVLDPSVPITNATQTFCNTAKVSDLIATGTNVKWYLQSTGGIALDPTSDLTDGTYYASQTLNNAISCESTNRASTLVTITKTPAPSGSGNQIVCNSGTISDLVASGTSILWYANATGGSPLNPTTALVNGTTYYASQTVNSCESSNRYALAVTITNPALPLSAGNQSVCQTNPIQTLIPVATSPDGGTITWYDAPTGGNLIASPSWNSIGSTTFYAQNNSNSCTSTARTPVALEIKAAPLLTITNTTCAPNLLTYSVTFNAAVGTNISVVPNVGTVSASGITNIPAGTNITINANVAGGCNEVIPIIAPDCSCPIVATPSASANQTICEGQNNPTLSVSVAAQETADWYTTQTGGTPFLTNALNFTPTVTAAGNYTYYVEARNTTTNCTSTTRIAVTLTIEGIAAPSGAANQTFCQIDAPTIANLAANGTNIKWYNSPTSTTPLATSTPLTDATYYATQTATNGLGCESVSRFAVAVTITKTPAPSGSGNQIVCNSGTIGDLIASGTSILWYANPSGGTPLNPTTALVNGTTYYASQTLSACESSNRYPLAVTITDPALPLSTGNQSVCQTNPIQTLIPAATSPDGGTITWYDAPTGGNLIASPSWNSIGLTTFYAQNNLNSCTSTARTPVALEIKAAPLLTITNKVCAPSLLTYTVTFNAAVGTNISIVPNVGTVSASTITDIPAGTNITINANVAGGCNEVIPITAPNCSCPIVATPIAGTNQTICEGQSNPTLSVSVAAQETADWYTTQTGGTPFLTNALNFTPTVTAAGNYTYYVEARNTTTNCTSTTRVAVTLTIEGIAAPSGAANQTFCQIDAPTIANLAASGSNIKWYNSPTSTTPLATSTPLTDATYYATQTATNGLGCESVSRFAVAVTITKTPAPSGSGSQVICNSGTINDLIASGTSILWYTNATGGSPLNSTTALVNGTTYYASQTVNSCESNTRYALAVTITNPALPLSTGNQSVCQTNPIQTLIPVATSPDGGTITWYDAPTGGNLIASPSWNSIGSTTFYAQNNSNSCTSTARTPVALEIKAAPLLTITNTTCAPNLLTYSVTFNATAGTNISVVPNVGTVSASGITNIPAGTNITINANVAGGCNEVIPITAPDCSCPIVATPIASANQTICEGQNNPTLSVSVAAQETADWYTTQTGGTPFLTNALNFTPTVTAAGNYTYYVEARNTTTNCTSTTRIAVTLTIEGIAAPSGAANQTFCQIDAPTIANLVANGTNIKWYNSPTSTTPLVNTTPLTDATYYATQTATNGLACESVSRFAVAVTITKTPAPSGSGNQIVCNSGTISDLIASGTSILWYTNPSGGTPLDPTTALVNGTTYYASQTLSACESVNRLSVSVIINQPISPIIKNEESFCASENATITSLTNRVTNSNTVNWYLTTNSTTPLSTTEKLVNGTVYYAATYTNSPIFCESNPRTLVKVNIDAPSKPDGNSNQFFCSSSLPKIKDLIVTSGVNIKWYDNNNTILSDDFVLIDGGKYYATQTIGICESVERFEVSVTILSPPTPTTNLTTQLFCIEQNPTLNSIAITKSNPLSNIKWYDSLTGGNLLPNDTALVNGNSYYAVEESINPIVCQSNNRLKVDIIIESASTPIVSAIEAPTCAKTTGSVILTGLPNGNWEIIPSSGASVFGTGATYKFENLSAGVSYNFKVKTANQCVSQASIEAIIPVVPLYPNAATIDVTQPTCNLPFGKIEFTQQNGMEYSIGGSYQTNPVFDNLQPGKYQTSIRNSNSTTCMINTEEIVINPIPKTIAFELKSYCFQNEFIVEIIPLNNSFSLNQVEITWIDKNQNSVGNDAKLNVTKTIGAIDDSIYPLEFTAKVANTATGCQTSQTISLSSIFCDIQKGISPDGNGSNEYFDLSTFSVKNISIFNRYGVEVYHKKDYKNEWRGQTNDGTSLPDGTYYYIITFNDETSKTGWIYVTKK